MKPGKQSPNTSLGKRVDELHRPPTWFERFRAWIEGLPKDLLYAVLTIISWLSLTALIGLAPRPPIERIIAQGIIERDNLAKLDSSNLIQATDPWMSLLGVGIVVATELGIAWYFLERFGRRILKTNMEIRLILAVSLTILFTALARFFIELNFNPYLTPLAGLSVIGTMLLGPRLVFLIVVATAINVGIMSGNDFLLTAALLLGSGFAIYTVVRVRSRQRLLKAGLFIAVVMGIVTFAVGLIGGGSFSAASAQGVLGLGNGILSLMLAMVLLPFLEDAFNILTPMKLLELSDPGNSLLQKLLRTAPGTFSHSMQVGNLAENAAERVGADPLLARVGAYYHDIGKMEHPAYFVENQIAQVNPHAALSPTLSAKVVKRHVKDGLEIGRAWGLPQEILDIIAQHHGSTRIEYFYRKALEEALDETEVNETDFRYSSGLPKSKEAGIMMLADSIEATVKSLPKPTPKRIEDVVADTIRKKIEDGQFDECDLTMRDIHAAGQAIREALIGFLGPRIEYPEAPTAAHKAATQKAAGDTT
jgi:putative nucleotidyltransferase with HDIG domain